MAHYFSSALLVHFLVSVSVACTGGKSATSAASSEKENGVAVIGGGTSTSGGADSESNSGGGSDATNPDNNTDNASSSGDASVDETGDQGSTPAGPPTELEGKWTKACVLINPSDPDEGYRIWWLSFEGKRFSSYIRNFTTPGCTSASAIYSQVIFQGYFEFGETMTSSEGLDVRQIDVHTQTPIDSVEYDIFYQDGDRLYFGDTSGQYGGTSVESRPNSLDFYWELIKDS